MFDCCTIGLLSNKSNHWTGIGPRLCFLSGLFFIHIIGTSLCVQNGSAPLSCSLGCLWVGGVDHLPLCDVAIVSGVDLVPSVYTYVHELFYDHAILSSPQRTQTVVVTTPTVFESQPDDTGADGELATFVECASVGRCYNNDLLKGASAGGCR